MFGISGEHLLILGIVLLIFGPRRLPELGNTLGKAIRNFKDSLSGVEEAKFTRLQEDANRTAAAAAAAAHQSASAAAAAQPVASTAATAAATTAPASSSDPHDPNKSGNTPS
jgi:sec-independent protein translocase protein TatA